jgi:hypothetical protein
MKLNNTVKAILTLPVLMMLAGSVNAQMITVEEPLEIKTFAGEPAQGRVDFISESAELKFMENDGEIIRPPQPREDGKYVYTCICDLNDKNNLGVNIALPGSVNKRFVSVFIKEGQWLEYNVLVEKIRLQTLETTPIVRKPDTATVKITSRYNGFVVKSSTGEEAEGPLINDNQTFDYFVTFDLSAPQSREIERDILIFTNKDEKPFKHVLGRLSPKQGIEIVAILLETSCYENQMSIVRQHIMNRDYRDAYLVLKTLLETDNCKDKPSDLSKEKAKMNEVGRAAAALKKAVGFYKKVEQFKEMHQPDSFLYYHGEAYKQRNHVLKYYPNDPYCLEYNKIYNEVIKYRYISGKILNNDILNPDDTNPPLAGAAIIRTSHRKKNTGKRGEDGHTAVEPENKIIENSEEPLGKTAEDGAFMVRIPRHTEDIFYAVTFLSDWDYGGSRGLSKIVDIVTDVRGKHGYALRYFPKPDAGDIISNLTVILSPKAKKK